MFSTSLSKLFLFVQGEWTNFVPEMFALFEHSVIPVSIHLLTIVLCVIFLLGAIAYSTVFERKSIALLQNRRGPNRAGFFGLLQAIGDGVKLVTKAQVSKKQTSVYLYYLPPVSALFLSWFLAFFMAFAMYHDWSLYFLLIWTSLNVYSLPIAGIVTSHSKFAFLGGIRSLAQLLSYELSLGVVFLIIVVYTSSPMLAQILEFQFGDVSLGNGLLPSFALWFILLLAETNRVPFDLPEAEAELVAGFATEYSSFAFAAFFLAEYASMLVFSYLTALLFFSTYPIIVLGVSTFFVFVWTRTTLPRFKIDQLLWLGWFLFLPLSLCFFVVVFYHFTIFNVFSGLGGAALLSPMYMYKDIGRKPVVTRTSRRTFKVVRRSHSYYYDHRTKHTDTPSISHLFGGGGSSTYWLYLPLANLLFSLYQFTRLFEHENYLYFLPKLEVLGPLSFSPFGAILFAVSNVVLFLVALRADKLRVTACLFSVILLPLFLIRELFSFFVCFELLMLPTLFLLLNNRDTAQLPRAGRILVLYSFFTMLFFLGVALYISNLCGTSTIEGILLCLDELNDEAVTNRVKTLLFFAFAFKMSLYPFHVWLPKAHVEGELEMSWILGGIVMKAGVFGLMTFCIIPFNEAIIRPSFLCVAILGAFLPLFLAATEMHLKRMIAYFSVSHMSFAVLLLLNFHEHMSPEESRLCVCGMMLACLHSFISCMLFYLVDTLYRASKNKNLALSSAIEQHPFITILALLFFLDNVGALPFTYNFYVEISAVFQIMDLENIQLLLVAALYLLTSTWVGFAQLLRRWLTFKADRDALRDRIRYPGSGIDTDVLLPSLNNGILLWFALLYHVFVFSIGMILQEILFGCLVIYLM